MARKSNIPKRKCLTKQIRLNSAADWIKKYNGKNIVSGYAKWFGVDKISAINELKAVGVLIPESLENQIIASHKSRIEQKRIIREKKKSADTIFIESDDNFAYIVGYTSGGFPYGLTHAEFKIIESEIADQMN
jgi:hypothetical protein